MSHSILVVDDEPGFREMLTFVLEPLGFEVTAVENGFEALKKIRERNFSVVLMDVHMPVMGGPETVKKIYQLRPEQKVIVFSSSLDPHHSQEVEMAQSVVACLYKPVELDDIQAAIQKAIGKVA